MSTPLFFPATIFEANLPKDGGISLRELCEKAGVPCRASGAWVDRLVAIDFGDDYKISAEPGGWGTVRIQVPKKLSETAAARNALAAMAYGLMDGVARESIRGASWSKPAHPAGRPKKGTAMNVRERQRAHQKKNLPKEGYVEYPVSKTTCLIPSTTPLCYLSGMAALNIPSDSGTGDWHMVETFFRPRETLSRLFIAGAGCKDDTTPLLADAGVYECSHLLDKYQIPHPEGKVYAASHARAIADMVLVTILDGGSPAFIRLDDWMPRDEDKQAVFDLLGRASSQLNEPQKNKVTAWVTASLS